MTTLTGILSRVGIAVVTAAAVLLPASAAGAATPTHDVQFSADGTHWSDSYTGALFGDAVLIPGGSADRAFYVRNGAADAALLRVTLFDVATTDTTLAGALSLITSTPGQPGTAVPVTNARPCATLTEGQTLASGDSIRIDTLAQLADLTGSLGQAHTVSFSLAVTLSSIDSAAPEPNTCPIEVDSGTVVGVPDPGTSRAATTVVPLSHLGATGWSTPATSATEPPTTPTTGHGTHTPFVPELVANTERLYQEGYVAFWLAMAVLGALIFFIVRRRRHDEDEPSQYQPTEQIGTGR